MQFTPTIIESPFKSNDVSSEETHRKYLERCILDMIGKGHTPYASHKMLTDALDDSDPGERELGMQAGLEMAHVLAKKCHARPFFFIDYGWSRGMKAAKVFYDTLRIRYTILEIGKNPE